MSHHLQSGLPNPAWAPTVAASSRNTIPADKQQKFLFYQHRLLHWCFTFGVLLSSLPQSRFSICCVSIVFQHQHLPVSCSTIWHEKHQHRSPHSTPQQTTSTCNSPHPPSPVPLPPSPGTTPSLSLFSHEEITFCRELETKQNQTTQFL